MMQAPTPKNKNKSHHSACRFEMPLRKAAARLGCHYTHLLRVLHGQRPSRSLIRRYLALLKEEAITPRAELEALANQPSAQPTPPPQTHPTPNPHNP